MSIDHREGKRRPPAGARGFLVLGLAIALISFGYLLAWLPAAAAEQAIVQRTPASSATPARLPTLAHIFLIMEENKSYAQIVGNPAAPYLNNLIKHYALASNYYALFHPSLPNYIALTSGSPRASPTIVRPPATRSQRSTSPTASRPAGATGRSTPRACPQEGISATPASMRPSTTPSSTTETSSITRSAAGRTSCPSAAWPVICARLTPRPTSPSSRPTSGTTCMTVRSPPATTGWPASCR